jgi:hypothetical protein
MNRSTLTVLSSLCALGASLLLPAGATPPRRPPPPWPWTACWSMPAT